MYSCKVGPDFKVKFFKRSLNFCYDKSKGIIYADDLITLERLGISKDRISDAYLSGTEGQELSNLKKICEELKEAQLKSEKTIEFLKLQLETIDDNVKVLNKTSKDIVEYQQEFVEQEEEESTQQEETNRILKNSIGILNKKIKESNESIENVGIRFEAIIELLAEQAANKQTFNIMGSNVSVDKIWNATKNKNDAAVLSIMYMMKKFMEDKGTRF